MKSTVLSGLSPSFMRLATLVALVCGLAAGAHAQVIGNNKVKYSPFTTELTPLIPSSQSFVLDVTSPPPPPTSTQTYPTTVPINVSMVSSPPGGLPLATALSYVTFAVSGTPVTSLTFTAPNQVISVTVTLNLPVGAPAGFYGYKILTTGWVASPTSVNDGAFINATASLAGLPPPPDVVITTPVDGSTITVSSLPTTVTVQYTATSTGLLASPITFSDVDVDGVSTTLVSSSGLLTTTYNSTSTIVINTAGQHVVTARATNLGGTATDVNTFRVVMNAAPPVVVINTPTPNSTYTYRAGGPAVIVPYTFTATSTSGVIRTLTAKVDGAVVTFTPNGLNTPTATGTINLSYAASGAHTLEVITTDDFGTDNDLSNFTVNLVAPQPTIDITRPLDNEVFTIPSGSTSVNVPFRFVSTSNNGFVVDSVSAMVGTVNAPITTTTGLGTANAVSEGTLLNLTAGTYTLSATATSSGITVSDFVTFTVRSAVVPPTVVITTPAPNAIFTRVSGGPALSIPLTFVGTSQTPGGVITQLRASLGSTPLTVTATNLNTRVATGNATMTVSNAGTYTINVTAIDAYGTANASQNFTVVIVQGKTICGDTFFDVDFDGIEDCDEFGLSGVTVKLYNSANQVIGTTTTDACGNYSFCNIGPGSYRVVGTVPTGLKATTSIDRTVTVSSSNVCVPDMGFGLNFATLEGMIANGFTIGYWKNNLDKAIAGKTSGVQVSKATLMTYTSKIADFALSPYDSITMKIASETMGYSGSNSSSLLSKQLIGSEYNYQNGAYLNGNKTLTFLFLYWGEYVLANPSKYSNNYRIWAKDWFDGYNNSHGSTVDGPSSTPPTN